MKKILLLLSLSVLAGCGGSSGGGGGATTTTNKFNESSRAMTNNDLAPAARINTQSYYGSFLYKNGSTVYAGGMHFVLENNGTNVFFKSFNFDKVMSYTGYNTGAATVTSGVPCFNTGTYDASSNFINISTDTKRLVKFSVTLGASCSSIAAAISNAGVVFSSDFTTMAGGNNADFFFLAQKGSAQGTNFAVNDLVSTWKMYWFDVNANGDVSDLSGGVSTITVSIGGNWSNSENNGTFYGSDPSYGSFIFKRSTSAASVIDGGFITTPDKSLALGIDLDLGSYFAASK